MSVMVARALVVGGAALGMPLLELKHRAGIPDDALTPEILADPDARVPAAHVVALWNLLSAKMPERPFGLWLAELVKDAPLTIAAYVIHTSPTLGEGLARALRYQRLLHDEARGEILTTERETIYRHQVGAFRAPNAALDFGFASIVNLARRATGRPVVPTRVSFQHAAPSDLTMYRAFFGEHVAFGQPYDEIVFSREDLDRPSVTADPLLREVLEAHAKVLLARLPEEAASASARARVALVELLSSGPPTLEQVGKKLGMPRRTLQRRLQDEGTRFETLVDEVRKQLAKRYLMDARISIQETAFLLGFSDVAAFHRAFVRWTGQTPARFRSQSH